MLSEGERQRAQRYRRDSDRAHFESGRRFLRLVLAECLACDPAGIRFESRCDRCGKPHGKPIVAWPLVTGFHFSFSSAIGIAAVALAADRRIGIDVEMVHGAGPSDFGSMALISQEIDELAIMPGADRMRALFDCWTRKEALLKAVGIGLAKQPASFYVGCLSQPGPWDWTPRPADPDFGRSSWKLSPLSLPHPYIGTVAVGGSFDRIVCRGFRQ